MTLPYEAVLITSDAWSKIMKAISDNRDCTDDPLTAKWNKVKEINLRAWTQRKEAYEVFKGSVDEQHETLVSQIAWHTVWTTFKSPYLTSML